MRLIPEVYAALYLALGCIFIYGVWNSRESFGEGNVTIALIVFLFVAVHVGFGFAIGSWWAVLLPFALALLAVPAGFPPSDEREPFAIWHAQAWIAVPEAVVMIPGILVRKLRDRPSSRRRELPR